MTSDFDGLHVEASTAKKLVLAFGIAIAIESLVFFCAVLYAWKTSRNHARVPNRLWTISDMSSERRHLIGIYFRVRVTLIGIMLILINILTRIYRDESPTSSPKVKDWISFGFSIAFMVFSFGLFFRSRDKFCNTCCPVGENMEAAVVCSFCCENCPAEAGGGCFTFSVPESSFCADHRITEARWQLVWSKRLHRLGAVSLFILLPTLELISYAERVHAGSKVNFAAALVIWSAVTVFFGLIFILVSNKSRNLHQRMRYLTQANEHRNPAAQETDYLLRNSGCYSKRVLTSLSYHVENCLVLSVSILEVVVCLKRVDWFE